MYDLRRCCPPRAALLRNEWKEFMSFAEEVKKTEKVIIVLLCIISYHIILYVVQLYVLCGTQDATEPTPFCLVVFPGGAGGGVKERG